MELEKKAVSVLCWIFGLIAILTSLPMFFISIMSGLAYLIIGFLLLPPAREYVFNRTNKTLSVKTRSLMIFGLFVISTGFSILATNHISEGETSNEGSKQAELVALTKKKNDDQLSKNIEQDKLALEVENSKKSAELAMFGEPPTFLGWNGSYQVVTSHLKDTANDPDSIKIDGCTEVYKTDEGWLVGCNYSGKNAFNAVISKSNWFTIVHDKVVAMHDYSKYKR